MALAGICQLHYRLLSLLAHVVDAQQSALALKNMWCARILSSHVDGVWSPLSTQSGGLNVELPPCGSVNSTTGIGRCYMFYNHMEVTFFFSIASEVSEYKKYK